MGWGIDFNIDIYLSRQDYGKNIWQVEEAIQADEKTINNIRTQISMFATASVADIVPKDWNEEPIRWVNNEVDELLNSLNEEIIHQYKLTLYLEYLKKLKEPKEEDKEE